MAQRYQTRFDSFEGLETVVLQVIEGFSQERFLASLHLNNRRTAMDIAAFQLSCQCEEKNLMERHSGVRTPHFTMEKRRN